VSTNWFCSTNQKKKNDLCKFQIVKIECFNKYILVHNIKSLFFIALLSYNIFVWAQADRKISTERKM
jgi:hypothetical protein